MSLGLGIRAGPIELMHLALAAPTAAKAKSSQIRASDQAGHAPVKNNNGQTGSSLGSEQICQVPPRLALAEAESQLG